MTFNPYSTPDTKFIAPRFTLHRIKPERRLSEGGLGPSGRERKFPHVPTPLPKGSCQAVSVELQRARSAGKSPIYPEAFRRSHPRGRMCALRARLRDLRFIGCADLQNLSTCLPMDALGVWRASIRPKPEADAPSADEERHVVSPSEHKHQDLVTEASQDEPERVTYASDRRIPWRTRRLNHMHAHGVSRQLAEKR